MCLGSISFLKLKSTKSENLVELYQSVSLLMNEQDPLPYIKKKNEQIYFALVTTETGHHIVSYREVGQMLQAYLP